MPPRGQWRGIMNFTIRDVSELLGLETKGNVNSRSFNVRCPRCDKEHAYHMNIDNKKNVFSCMKCGVSGGTLDLYVMFSLKKEPSKETRHEAAIEIEKRLNITGDDKQRVNCYSRHDEYINDDYTKLNDTQLDKVYSALLSIPALRLSDKHCTSLKGRGLADEEIAENGYRTLPEELWFPKGRDWSFKTWDNEGLERFYQSTPEIKNISRKHLISGLYIARCLTSKGLDVADVPGFFKIKNLWCFRYTPGILIPVRNAQKEIVGFQVRKERGKPKYITLSSKGFPEGTGSRTRVHFAKGNPPINPNTEIRITEGPLKADVALSLTKRFNVVYLAIMGINGINELNTVLRNIKPHDCECVADCLDMDKLTNANVVSGAKKLKEMITKYGHRYHEKIWDVNTIHKVLHAEESLLKDNGCILPKRSSNDIEYIKNMTMLLKEHNIEYDHEWLNPETKGIDDYLRQYYKFSR